MSEASSLLVNSTSRFADVAHQTLTFDKELPSEKLVLDLLNCSWVQRLRSIRQTGNTSLVYMFAEHSRFGHSLGVAYLASLLMKNLERKFGDKVKPWKCAVTAAALLHDIGHCAPGSHLAERVWSKNGKSKHEELSKKIILEDPEISAILKSYSQELPEQVVEILSESENLPGWTHQIISGGGWNADRGNWAIVDSAMCSVNYGRYNVTALLDSFLISSDGDLVIHENRLDALTHFYLARDSMYRQIYQHRVLQTADSMVEKLVERASEIDSSLFFADNTMNAALSSKNPLAELPLEKVYSMTDYWWTYHVEKWTKSEDSILADLANRLFTRKLFKTIRLSSDQNESESFVKEVEKITREEFKMDPSYYVLKVGSLGEASSHYESPPLVVLDNGKLSPASEIEPIIAKIIERPEAGRQWLAVPEEIKLKIGVAR